MKLEQNYSLKHLNTFGIDQQAASYVLLREGAELAEAINQAKGLGQELRVLGGGSNLLLTQDQPHFFVQPGFDNIQVLEESNTTVQVRVDAGFNWHNWVLYSLNQGWYGLENLSLIPGMVGAAPIQNIGAYGVEVKDFVKAVHFRSLRDASQHVLSNEECRFAYRDSLFKQELKGEIFIESVVFELLKQPNINTSYGAIEQELEAMAVKNPSPKDVSAAVIKIRQSKLPDPAVLGNSGSFFKNPILPVKQVNSLQEQFPNIPVYPISEQEAKVAAGWLIEQSGWKGKRVGPCGVHEKQALVLVNYGGASGAQVLSLAKDVISAVEERFSVSLEPEVNVW